MGSLHVQGVYFYSNKEREYFFSFKILVVIFILQVFLTHFTSSDTLDAG